MILKVILIIGWFLVIEYFTTNLFYDLIYYEIFYIILHILNIHYKMIIYLF